MRMGRDSFDVMLEFLWARIREDETAAQALRPGKNQDVARLQARVLADVEAKRRLIGWVEDYPWWAEEIRQRGGQWQEAGVDVVVQFLRDPRRQVVYELVAAYRDHPDFHRGWLPIKANRSSHLAG
jgi:hypothetical protein